MFFLLFSYSYYVLSCFSWISFMFLLFFPLFYFGLQAAASHSPLRGLPLGPGTANCWSAGRGPLLHHWRLAYDNLSSFCHFFSLLLVWLIWWFKTLVYRSFAPLDRHNVSMITDSPSSLTTTSCDDSVGKTTIISATSQMQGTLIKFMVPNFFHRPLHLSSLSGFWRRNIFSKRRFQL